MRKQWPTARNRLRTGFADRIIPIAFWLSVVGISGVGFLAYYLFDRSQESEAWVLHTTVAISRLEAMHKTLVEAESAGRAFLITGEPRFRQSFDDTLTKIDSELHTFKKFTSDNKIQQDLAAELALLIEKRFAYLEGQVRLRAADGLQAVTIAKIAAGAVEMQLISAVITEMKQVENRLLADRSIVRKRNNNYLQGVLALLIVGAITVISMIFAFMNGLWKQRKAAEEKAMHLAQHDVLTGLPNRRLLSDRVQMELARAARYDEILAILCLDLDGFKLVNDAHGHDAGDTLLQLVSDRLREVVRAVDTVARIGGDEFVLALPRLKEPKHGESVAAKLLERIAAPYVIGGRQVTIGTSIGIAFYPMHGATRDELLRHADQALYEAKRQGKLRYQVASYDFIAPHAADVEKRLSSQAAQRKTA